MEYYFFIIIGVGSYYLVSFFFCLFPRLLHRKKENHFDVKHISHRGGSGEEIENSIEAFDNALVKAQPLEKDNAMLELDVHLTQDNEVVVAHDPDLKRTCGVAKLISETKFEDLPPMLPELGLEFFDGPPTYNKTGQERRIPTLEAVFEKYPEVFMNIDIKANNDELITQTDLLIRSYQREKKTVWGNGHDAVATKLHKKNSEVPLFFSSKRVYCSIAFFFLGILPFIPIKETHFEVFLPYRIKCGGGFCKAFSDLMWNLLAFVVLNRLYIYHLKQRGIKIYYWVLNTEEEFNKAERYGADAIMTDFPAKLTSWLRDKENRLIC